MGIPIEKLPYHLQQRIKRQETAPSPTDYRTNRQSLAGLGSSEPKPEQRSQSEDRSLVEGKAGLGYRVVIVSYRRRRVDGHDNLRSAHKALVDRITETLGFTTDDDARLDWCYEQIVSKTTGTHVLITAKP